MLNLKQNGIAASTERTGKTVEIKVVSEDSGICQLCSGILDEIPPGQPCSLSTASPEALGAPADLYIWDFQPNVPLPEHIIWTHSNVVVLAHRRDMAEVQEAFGFEPNVVLKPATRATLSALVGFAVSNHAALSLRDDRDRMFQFLIEANLKLQEYDQDRTNFLTRVVHDFRAPLTALSGYCGLLLDDPLGSLNENQREVIRRMKQSAKRLSRLSCAMLQLSADRQTKSCPDLQRGDLQRSLEGALHELEPLARDRRITITSNLAPGDGLYFDPSQLEQVLVNILDNACKFTPRGGSIEIQGYPFFRERRVGNKAADALLKERRARDTNEPNSYRLDIRDSGSAIAEEHLESIFEEYTSYSGGRDRSGGGLGLAICRMIIDQHSGRIWAENTDKGPMFSFILPLRQGGSGQLDRAVLSARA
jgi:signal transduction histidine kinase